MSIQDWGAIGELLGSIAVLVTLIYLASQIRIARKTIATTALADLRRAFSSVNQQIISSEDVALLYSRGLRDPLSLSESEEIRFRMLVREGLSGYYDLFRTYKRGDIDRNTFERMGFSVYASIPGVARFLESQEGMIDSEIEEYLANAPKIDGDTAYSLIMGGLPRDA